jgi:hypothetical protein
LKYPPVLSKFRPADVDPTFLPVFGRALTKSEQGIQQQGKMHHALYLLGIDPIHIFARNSIYPSYVEKKPKRMLSKGEKESFWNRSHEYLMRLLALAKRKYQLEVSHAYKNPSKTSYDRIVQLNLAWEFVEKMFAKKGYKLP